MSSKYILVVDYSPHCGRPFGTFGIPTIDTSILNHPDSVTFALFTGGSDVSPWLYNEQKGRYTSCHQQRDVDELEIFRECFRNEIPMFGICRGAQFLCVMAGGSLCQHVTGHEYNNHFIRTWDDRQIMVNSCHHQMALPPEDAEVLAWTDPSLSTCYLDGHNMQLPPPEFEYESVYYPNINALGTQWHPESLSSTSRGFKLTEELIHSFILNKEKTIEKILTS
jgi:hypothetical protein